MVHSSLARVGLQHAWAQYFLALLMIDRIDNGFCSQGPPMPRTANAGLCLRYIGPGLWYIRIKKHVFVRLAKGSISWSAR